MGVANDSRAATSLYLQYQKNKKPHHYQQQQSATFVCSRDMRLIKLIAVLLTIICVTKSESTITKLNNKIPSKAYFVSPELGDDKNNDGLSQQKPLKTLQNAESKASPGDTVYLMNGVYHNVGFGTGKTKNLSPVLVYVGRIFVRLSLELLSPCLVLVVIILPCSCIL